MSVALLISETAGGGAASDSLAGGGTGIDFGVVSNGGFTPRQDIYISSNAVDNPITDLKFYIAPYTSAPYGGARTAAADFQRIADYGAANAGATADNSDGLSSGIHMDMSWDASGNFQPTRAATGQLVVFGKTVNGKNGLSLATAFDCHVDAMSYFDGTTEVDATGPVQGEIGVETDAVRGNRAHIKISFYLPSNATEGGTAQIEFVIGFAYTS
jgi:hypothetical protein